MEKLIGIRREDKNIWERRVPLIPKHIKKMKEEHSINFIVQPFERRTFSDDAYREAGAEINEDLSRCPIIMAVKEIPVKLLMPEKTYIYFSHTIKGQSYNMPMLKQLMKLKCTLIDYELISDSDGRRLVFFGKYAGLAGMVEALYGMGLRYKSLGYETPFLKIRQPYHYSDINEAKKEIKLIAEEISISGLPRELQPLVVGFTGYGNVSKGAQDIFNLLPNQILSPEELLTKSDYDQNILYKVVFKEEHMVEPADPSAKFKLKDYFKNPENYKSVFEKYIPKLSVVINAIYWNEKSPIFITKKYFKENRKTKLQVIADISCDINGSVEFTEKVTMPDSPAYVYDGNKDTITDGYEGEGVVNIAIDNLPTELPRDASIEFSRSLNPFIPGITAADLNLPFEECNFPPEIKKAVILYKGELTPGFQYLKEYLKK